jgi:hypothetical protein
VDAWDDVIRRITPDLEAAEAELRAVTQRVEGLRFAIRYALEAKADAARQTGSPAQPATVQPEMTEPAPYAKGVADGGPTRTCERVLVEAGGALKTPVIRERMNAISGREWTPEQVRGALAYLQRKHRVDHVAPGLWRTPRAPASSKGFAPANGAGASATGENGTSVQALTFSSERA